MKRTAMYRSKRWKINFIKITLMTNVNKNQVRAAITIPTSDPTFVPATFPKRKGLVLQWGLESV